MSVFTIYADHELLYSSEIPNHMYSIVSPRCSLAIGEEGSAEFEILPTHPLYNRIYRMKTRIQFYQDDECIFSGRVTEVTTAMDLTKSVSCEGDLNLLLDSLQPPMAKTNKTITAFMEQVIAAHNAEVDSWKQFRLGNVTVQEAVDQLSIPFELSGYTDTKSVLTDSLVNVYGGYFQTRLGLVSESVARDDDFTTTLKNGSKGSAVSLLQTRLNTVYPNETQLAVDGIFGNRTQARVELFQTDHSLTVSGEYDRITHDALMLVLYGPETQDEVEIIYLDYLADPYYEEKKEITHLDGDVVYPDFPGKRSVGSSGRVVKQIQEWLISAGYSVGGTKADGQFGNKTERAVKQVQADNGLSQTGVYDQQTHDALMRHMYGEETVEVVTTPTNNQGIHFGVNIIDMSEEYPIDEIFTILLPIGKNDITISSVNNGSIYLENANAIERYGRIVKTYTWSNASTAATLLNYATEYLKTHTAVFPNNYTITALDLHLLDDTKERFTIGSWIHVTSEAHNIDEVLCCLEIELDVQSPENSSYKVGTFIPANFDSDTSDKVTSRSGNISRKV